MVDFAILWILSPNIGEDAVQQDPKHTPTHLITIRSYTTAVVPYSLPKKISTDRLLKNKLVVYFLSTKLLQIYFYKLFQ